MPHRALSVFLSSCGNFLIPSGSLVFLSKPACSVLSSENLHELTQAAGSLAQFSGEATSYLEKVVYKLFFFFSEEQTFLDKSIAYALGGGVHVHFRQYLSAEAL